jgi:hypothetical protein
MVQFPAEATDFFLSKSFTPAPGVLSPQIKWPVHEAEHSALPSAEVKNEWGFASTSTHGFVTYSGTTGLVISL